MQFKSMLNGTDFCFILLFVVLYIFVIVTNQIPWWAYARCTFYYYPFTLAKTTFGVCFMVVVVFVVAFKVYYQFGHNRYSK